MSYYKDTDTYEPNHVSLDATSCFFDVAQVK